MKNYNLLVLLGAILLLASCAREVNESSDVVEKRLLEAYVSVTNMSDFGYDGEVQLKPSGLYFIPKMPQHPGASPEGEDVIYMRYTIRTMSETITETKIDSLAKMMGWHSKRNYYGPQIYTMATGAGMRGLQEAFSYMKPGDKARILLPTWLSNFMAGGNRSHGSTMIYDLELVHVVPDIAAFQTDSLKQYSVNNFSGVDSLKYDWYFISTTPGDGELPEAGDTIKIRYAGYFLDGFLFDTNIKDVAELHYGDDVNPSATYEELKVIMDEDVSKMSVVEGFAYAIQQMSDGEEATTFFSSDRGYGITATGQIQPYSMLRFDIKVTIARKVEEGD